jgi:Protein of unknown function (DUF3800)
MEYWPAMFHFTAPSTKTMTCCDKIIVPLDSQPDLDGSFVGRLSQSLYPRTPCGRLFVILTAYYDESGTHEGSPATVLAGFVGTTNDWVDFEIEWSKVLRKYGLTHVRAKQLFHGQGQFKRWSDEQFDHLWADLMYVLQERKQIFASKSVLREDDYRMFYVSDGPAKKERLDTRYALCFRSFLHFLPAVRSGAIAVNFVLESGHKNGGDALRVFDETKNDKTIPWRRSIGSLSFGTKQDSPALQAADLLAYCSYREEREIIEDGSPDGTKFYDGIDMELVYGCGLTILEHRIYPDDLKALRQNFLRRHKRPVFGHARMDAFGPDIDPSSHYAQHARMRPAFNRS